MKIKKIRREEKKNHLERNMCCFFLLFQDYTAKRYELLFSFFLSERNWKGVNISYVVFE